MIYIFGRYFGGFTSIAGVSALQATLGAYGTLGDKICIRMFGTLLGPTIGNYYLWAEALLNPKDASFSGFG